MRGFNRVILAGRLGQDPEVRHTQSGKAVANISLAVSAKRGSGEQAQEQTHWFTCVFWEQAAELIQQYCAKGSSILLEGRLQTRSWEEVDGNKRTAVEVVADRFEFLDKKEDSPPQQQTYKPPPQEKYDDPGDGLPFS